MAPGTSNMTRQGHCTTICSAMLPFPCVTYSRHIFGISTFLLMTTTTTTTTILRTNLIPIAANHSCWRLDATWLCASESNIASWAELSSFSCRDVIRVVTMLLLFALLPETWERKKVSFFPKWTEQVCCLAKIKECFPSWSSFNKLGDKCIKYQISRIVPRVSGIVYTAVLIVLLWWALNHFDDLGNDFV